VSAPTAQKPAAPSPRIDPDGHIEPEEKVTPLELFFDLVFVFAITQVTSLLSHDPTWQGLGRGLLVLCAIWWAWVAYSWLTNTIDPEEGVARIGIFVAMAGMFVVALAAPQAFGAYGVLFGCAYFVVRALHIVMYAYSSPTVGISDAVRRMAPGMIVGSGLLILAGTQDGTSQAVLWVLAILLDFTAPIRGGMEGWEVHPSHFAERHGLIVIIALGESIVAIGVGLQGIGLDFGIVAGALIGVVIAGTLWWAYFDIVAIVAERKLSSLQGAERASIARDSYSYIHLLMITGVVLLALGVKKAVVHIHDPLDTVPAVALCGGVALYFLGHIAFRLRNVHSWNHQRLAAALACLALIPLATQVDALIALAAVAAVCIALVAYEAVHFREARERIRQGGLPESMMAGQRG
jgi:low temperature requirement protein LtrA